MRQTTNRGARKLRANTRDHGALAAVAVACGVSRQAVGHWVSGASRPTGRYRLILRRLYQIPYESWDEEVARA